MIPTDELEDLPRSSRRRWIALAFVLVVAIAAVVTFTRPAPDHPEDIPDFDLPLLSGDGSVSKEELLGNPVVINFWASWCEPCREEAPLFERTYKKYEDEGVVFLGVNVQDTKESAQDFVEEYGITYPVVTDYPRELARALGMLGLPQTFFIDADGRLAAEQSGEEIGPEQGTVRLGAIEKADLRTRDRGPAGGKRVVAASAERQAGLPGLVLGMTLFIASELVFFGSLFGAYYTLRARAEVWPPAGTPELGLLRPAVLTLVLLASSVTQHLAAGAHRAGDLSRAKRMLALTIALGVLFLAGAAWEWAELIGEGFTASSNAYGTLFFTLTGAHGIHLTVGLVILVMAGIRMGRPRENGLMEAATYYWHFVDVVWLGVAASLFLLGA